MPGRRINALAGDPRRAFGRKGLVLPRAQRAKKDVVIEQSAGRKVIQVSAVDAAGGE